MSGTTVLLRQRERDNRKPFSHITKAEYAEDFRATAVDLHAYADQPRAAAAALKALDHADRLDQHPRCGWYPRRPRGWRP